MVYAIQYRSERDSGELVEMTAAEWRTEQHSIYPRYVQVTAQRAHKWVKDGHIHMTPLYVDNGKIRRATDAKG